MHSFDLDALLATLSAAPAAPEPAASQPAQWLVQVTPRDAALANGGEPLLLLRELRHLGGRMTCDLSGLPPLALLDVPRAWLRWDVHLPGSVARADIEEIFDFAGDSIDVRIATSVPADALESAGVAVAAIVAAPAASTETGGPELAAPQPPSPAASAVSLRAAAAQTIRVDLGKLERLFDTVGELVIAQAMLAQHLADQPPATLECLGLLDTLTRDLQDNVMAIRAQPVAAVFNRMPRLVRELAEATGKSVALEISGEATELDKLVVERLAEPLTHLVRNAIDHGIEDASARRAAGKPGEGSLRLAAGHRGGRIFITLADDGRGIDRPRVLAKAIERGLVPADARLDDEEIDNLIFAPGFSTASNVSSISGRGVGMDVVRQTVKELGGRITIQSEPGLGSVFTLTLPLTLAIADGMIVRAGSETLVVPLLTIIETLRPPADLLHQMGTRQMLNMRGEFVPVIDLADAVGATSCTDGVLIIVETESAARVALRVDAILDNRQFVIKSLENNYRPVPGIAGATILGDGHVALIIDVEAVVARALIDRRAA